MVVDMKFVKKGNKIIVKQIVPDFELTPKALLFEIKQVEEMINKTKGEIDKMKEQIKAAEHAVVENQGRAKDLLKFKDWALNIQKSKVRALVDELSSNLIAKVVDEYVYDNALTAEGNAAQQFRQYQHYIATNPKVSDEIAPDVIKSELYDSDLLGNPFDNK